MFQEIYEILRNSKKPLSVGEIARKLNTQEIKVLGELNCHREQVRIVVFPLDQNEPTRGSVFYTAQT